jgi:hypothetical protein
VAGLDIRNASNGAPPRYQILHLEWGGHGLGAGNTRGLSPGRQPPVRRGGGEEPVPVSDHRTQQPRAPTRNTGSRISRWLTSCLGAPAGPYFGLV